MKQVLFIQGGGDGGYLADKILVNSLKDSLGKDHKVEYPEIRSEETLPDYGWTKQIGDHIRTMNNGFVLAGHSFGASMILKYLTEHPIGTIIDGVFLLGTPFWSGNESWQKKLKLKDNFANKLPDSVPIFFYHCKDDEEIPIAHLYMYRRKLPKAIFHEINSGGHQFNNGLMRVVQDIKSL